MSDTGWPVHRTLVDSHGNVYEIEIQDAESPHYTVHCNGEPYRGQEPERHSANYQGWRSRFLTMPLFLGTYLSLLELHSTNPAPVTNDLSDFVRLQIEIDSACDDAARLAESEGNGFTNRILVELATLRFWYKNHRGESGWRNVIPSRVFYGTTEWHKEPGWLLEGFDTDRKQTRSFAFDSIDRGRFQLRTQLADVVTEGDRG